MMDSMKMAKARAWFPVWILV
jgi:hypothetical protein